MMNKTLIVFILYFAVPFFTFPQRLVNPVLDTIETGKGPVILFSNHTWEYLLENPELILTEEDSVMIFDNNWNNSSVHAYGINVPDSIRDTALLLATAEKPFCMPVKGTLFRGFMYTHKGLDIRLTTGDTIKAAFDGIVRYARYNRGGYGNLVIIRHTNGLETFYAHLSKITVKENESVLGGETVGLGGSTGRSRGPHLHFEVRYKGVAVNPQLMINLDSAVLFANRFPITKQVFYPAEHDMNAVYHKIKSGDTLGHLAVRYHTSVAEICAMNKIRTTTTLKIGRVLRVK
jgi:LysM repeat protein